MRVDPVKTQYSVVLDVSIIAALVLTIVILHTVTISRVTAETPSAATVIELVRNTTTQTSHAPPPRRPAVPVPAEQAVLLGDETIDDTDIDLEETPPPPPPPFKREKSSDEVFSTYDTRPLLKGGEDFLKRNLRYPDAARQAGIEGVAVVKAVIDDKGNVLKADVVKEDGNVGFGQAAAEFVMKCKFEPALLKGKPVKVAVTLPISFSRKLL